MRWMDSESSMFVWPHKLILKTCGTTTLLLGLPTLLRIASETCGLRGVWRCFYSRKTFMFPDRQRGPHKDWAQEMSFLDQLFGRFAFGLGWTELTFAWRRQRIVQRTRSAR